MAASKLREHRNEIIRVVTAAWLAAPAGAGVNKEILPLLVAAATGDDVSPQDKTNKKAWARLRVQHTNSRATSISRRSYRNEGTITINVFTFRDTTGAWNDAELLADYVATALKKYRGSTNLTGITVRERPVNNGFSQVDVVAGFYWTEFNEVAK